MSFCQKHKNHHCIHAHQCNKKQHKKQISQKNLTTSQKLCKRSKQHNNQQNKHECMFIVTKNEQIDKKKNVNAQFHINKQWQKRQLKLKENIQLLNHQNRHLYTQIEYYRQQFTSIIQSNATDGVKQIKRHIQQQTQLSLQLKRLRLQLNRVNNENLNLKQLLQAQRSKNTNNINDKIIFSAKNKQKNEKLKIIAYQKQQIKQQNDQIKRKYSILKQNYQILKKQTERNCLKNKKQIQYLQNQVNRLTKQFQKLKQIFNKQKQLLNIQIQTYKKNEQIYKNKINQLSENIKLKSHTLNQLTSKYQQINQQYKHTKNILEKTTLAGQTYQKLKNNLQQKIDNYNNHRDKVIINKNYQIKQKQKQNYNDNQNQLIRLKQQNQKLKQQNKKYSLNSQHIQQYILSIGASQAFRRLLQQKNNQIKKLMRQKGQILNKISYNL